MKQEKSIQDELKEIKALINQNNDIPMSLNEAFVYLKISKAYLYKLVCLKQISYFKPNGKLLYFSKSDLNNWIFRNRNRSKAELEQEATEYLSKS
jgi:excisionase family DNA binding protein